MSNRTVSAASVQSINLPIAVRGPAVETSLKARLKDAGAILTVLSLIGIGCALPFCG